jgi:hypothetical protein
VDIGKDNGSVGVAFKDFDGLVGVLRLDYPEPLEVIMSTAPMRMRNSSSTIRTTV